MALQARKKNEQENSIVYMEVYGINRVIYRVTASAARRKGKPVFIYGVTLEDARTGSSETLESFSEDMEHTIQFTNSLVKKHVRPEGLYNEALRHLRMEKLLSPGKMLMM